ncbi:ABC transporter substrate-binding protein [Kibdelosporangium lantanae]|uniref:ABC transporter substrate-binding protein n=1 Tax=Kibdelosporangium lantanae TaxID=1497396 RepID=A0ABW3M433_9PSEU
MRLRNVIPVLLAFTLTACGASTATGDGDLTKVVLKVGDQKGSQKALLTAAGLLNAPYRIEWSTFTSGPPLLEAASGGAIDIGSVGNTPPIFAAAANAKISIVSAAKGNVTSDAILVPADSPLRTVQDLRGKNLAVAKGSSAHGQTLLTLKAAGLSTKDLKLAFLQPADAYAAFTQKRVDAWAIWDPYTSQALQETNARVLVDGTGTANGYTFEVAGRNALADTGKAAAIKDYVTRIAKAQKWSDTHRSEWAAAWAADTGLPLKVTEAATASGPDLPVPLDPQLVESEQQLADAFTADGVLTAKVDFTAFVDKRYAADLEAARSNP